MASQLDQETRWRGEEVQDGLTVGFDSFMNNERENNFLFFFFLDCCLVHIFKSKSLQS